MSARQYLTDIYLSWVNDFISVACFAEYHGITDAQAADLITLARGVYNTDHAEELAALENDRSSGNTGATN